jgi:hypothetical protein
MYSYPYLHLHLQLLLCLYLRDEARTRSELEAEKQQAAETQARLTEQVKQLRAIVSRKVLFDDTRLPHLNAFSISAFNHRTEQIKIEAVREPALVLLLFCYYFYMYLLLLLSVRWVTRRRCRV